MQFITYFIPEEIQILHNMGVFGYKKLPIILYLLNCSIFPLTLCIIFYLLYIIIFKRTLIKNIFYKSLSFVTILALIICIFTYSDVFSKIYFARGFSYYLNLKDAQACSLYQKSLELDKIFVYPLNGLIDIYKENTGNVELLNLIAKHAEEIDKPDVYLKVGRILKDNGNSKRGHEFYRKALRQDTDVELRLQIIKSLIDVKDFDQAEKEIQSLKQNKLADHFAEEITFYELLISSYRGYLDTTNSESNRLLVTQITDPRYFIQEAKNFQKKGDEASALESLAKAISIKKEFPEAYFEIAKIFYAKKDYERTDDALRKVIYYDNNNSLAFAMLRVVSFKNWFPLESIKNDPNIIPSVYEQQDKLQLYQGDLLNFTIKFDNIPEYDGILIDPLQPYGFGLKCELLQKRKEKSADGNTLLYADFKVEALRPSRVNLGQPWSLNIVLVDLHTGTYCNKIINITVLPKKNDEGRVLFVLTEDHEQGGDFPHTDDTPDIIDKDPYEINIDLVQKGLVADSIASKYGIKWSHIVDIGSSFLNLQWIQNEKHGGQWDNVLDDTTYWMKKAISDGHDIQLHIHAYNIPDNKLFRQYYDSDNNKIMFKDNIYRVDDDQGAHGAWAENYTNVGSYLDPQSRVGSIFRGIKILEEELHEIDPFYRTIFFRAGEYEFGSSETTISKSVYSLQKNKILCGSDSIEGSPFTRDFKFFNRIGDNVYFSKPDDIHEKATTLIDIGLLEILPVPKSNANNYITPTDDWKNVKYNYELCFENGKIKNDIYIIMEMYHLNNVNWANGWDRIDLEFGDWKKIDDHFKYIKKNCPKMEFVTISEAIKIYLDDYSPDILALRTNEQKLNEKLYSYDIEFYGKDIQTSQLNPHFVSIKPPSYFIGKIEKIELFHKDTLEKSWFSVRNYEDLEFTIKDKKEYSIKVYLD